MIIRHVDGVLKVIDTDKKEIKLERLGRIYTYKYTEKINVKQLERQLGEAVELIFHDDLLARIS
ncbi:hypothetical protein [Nitrososphaera sp.]|uniref:hypothetical protein n=1 Tax=Nitrososphaera sp. TaxID=1971748 RepID=UPI00317D113E